MAAFDSIGRTEEMGGRKQWKEERRMYREIKVQKSYRRKGGWKGNECITRKGWIVM